MGFRTDIQGLRGVSVLLVVLYHAGLPVPGGFVGVDVFFAISGFVITGLLLRELQDRDGIDLRRFYARRVRRLLPALAVLLVVVSVASVFLLSPFFPQPLALETGLWASLSAGNLYLWLFGGGYFSPSDEQNPLVHTWSLGVEEQFYLAFPLLIVMLWRLGKRTGRPEQMLTIGVSAVALVSFVISVVFTHDIGGITTRVPAGERLAFYAPFGRAWEFAAGVLLALAMRKRRTLGPAAVGWVGLIGLVVVSLLYTDATPFPGLPSVLPVAFAVMLLANGSTGVRAVLEHRSLVWLGDLSYSWYLWHWPLIVFAGVVAPGNSTLVLVAAVVSLVPSVISYRYVESALRATSETTNRSSIKVAATSIAVPLALIVVALIGAGKNWGLDAPNEGEAVSPLLETACIDLGASIDSCTFAASSSDGARRILVIGDSHSRVVASPVIEVAHERGYDVVTMNPRSCPFTMQTEILDDGCIAHNRAMIEVAASLQPDVIVVANRTERYLAQMELGTAAVTPDIEHPASDATSARWVESLEMGLEALLPHTDELVLFATVPSFSVEEFDAALPSLVRPSGTDVVRAAEEQRKIRQPWLDAEQAMADRLGPNVQVVDGFDLLCDTECRLRDPEGRNRYRDTNHLNEFMALELVPLFEDALPS